MSISVEINAILILECEYLKKIAKLLTLPCYILYTTCKERKILNLELIKQYLIANNVDVWLIYSFRNKNPIIKYFVKDDFLTRRTFVFIYPNRDNIILCHELDKAQIKAMDNFKVVVYKDLHEMKNFIESFLLNCKNVMMEISEDGMLAGCYSIDYGTGKMIEKLKKNLISSGDIIQQFTSTIDNESLQLHKKASKKINEIKDKAIKYIFQKLQNKHKITEFMVQQYILQEFEKADLITDDPPIVAVGKNTKNPHYQPREESSAAIEKNQLVMIDLWAKVKNEKAVFADITWMAYTGYDVPKIYQDIFDVVKIAIDKTLEYLAMHLPNERVEGWQVDDFCRNIIKNYGYADFFIHRTGHSLSIGECDHGNGVNIDNYENRDARSIQDNVAFSIEPGIYLHDFGVREEINVYISNKQPVVTTPRQSHILTFKDFKI